MLPISEVTRCLEVWLRVFWNLVSHFGLHLRQFLSSIFCINWSAALFSSKQNKIATFSNANKIFAQWFYKQT